MNKFWSRSSGHNRVTTRPYGEIPGILEAKDILVSVPLEEMRAATSLRAQRYCTMIEDVICGAMRYPDFKNHRFHSEDTALSVIRNPSRPYKKDW